MESKNKKLPTGSNVVLPDIQIEDGDLSDPYQFFDQRLKTRYLARRMGLDERTLKSHLEKAGIEVRRGEFNANELLNLVKVIAISKDRRVAVNKPDYNSGVDEELENYQLEDYVQGGWVHCNKPMLMIQFQEAMKKTLENRKLMRELMEIDNCLDLLKELVSSAVVVLDEKLINTLRSGDADKIELVQEVTAEIRRALGDKLIETVTSFEGRSDSYDLAELYNITEAGNAQPNTEDNG